ncbi:MAG: polysaccharide deacetylase family protein, partial [Patescibacteria group bacterium]
MMYFTLSKKKISSATIFALILAATLTVGIYYVNSLPDEYTRLSSLRTMMLMPFRAFSYGINYTTSDSTSRHISLAALGNLVNPGKITISTATTTVARDVPVLLYHGIVDESDRFSMTPKTFADQMFTLKRAGYHTVSLEDFNAFLRGEKVLDNGSFVLTFDDGRLDSYYGADPVLQALGFTAVMYVATADSLHVDRPLPSYYLHEGLLSRMVRSGRWELGSHAIQESGGFVPVDASGTKGNFLSNKMWLGDKGRLENDDEFRTRITRELTASKKDLQDIFGISVISM